MSKLISIFFVSVSLLLSTLLPVSIVHAQEEAPAPSTQVEQLSVSGDELRSFAKAYLEFEKIHAEYALKIGTAETNQEKGMVEQEAVIKFSKALEKEGLTMQQYSAMYQTVGVDPQLREKIFRLIEEERARS